MNRDIEIKRECLKHIVRIAALGASSFDPDDVRVSLDELKWALNEFLDSSLSKLEMELSGFRPTADALTPFDKVGFAIRSTWN